MTLVDVARQNRTSVAPTVVTAIVGAALLARPQLIAHVNPTVFFAALFGAIFGLSVAWPLSNPARASQVVTIAATACGVAAVAAARVFVGQRPAVPLARPFVVLIVAAAIAEELFFRRLLYGWLRPRGVAVAMVATAAMFAIVHVTTYGWWVVPLDLAIGLLFAWQREITGSWAAPAVTHVVANLLVVL